jgi:FkbM family methyltransferase
MAKLSIAEDYARGAPAAPADTRVTSLRLPRRPDVLSAGTSTLRWVVVEAPRQRYVPRVLEQKGLAGYEPDALACFLACASVAQAGAVWDIGANIGVYGLLARALLERPVRAFEPTPELASLAEGIAEDNALPYPVERIALGAVSGKATFYLSDVTDSSNSLAAGFRPSSRALTVTVDTIDAVVDRTGEVPAVLKIDTESTEPDVLRGADRLVREFRPWILCEVLAGRSEAALMDVLARWGYHWFHITGTSPFIETTRIVGDPTYTYMMWLFAPEPPLAEFWRLQRAWLEQIRTCLPVSVGAATTSSDSRLRRELAATQARLAHLEESRTLEAGRIVADVMRHPLLGARSAPRRVYKLWRRQRAR